MMELLSKALSAARPHDPKHRFDEAPVVTSATPGVRWLTQTMRLHLRPLGVRQHESFHPKLESQPSFRWNPDSHKALVQYEVAPWQNHPNSPTSSTKSAT